VKKRSTVVTRIRHFARLCEAHGSISVVNSRRRARMAAEILRTMGGVVRPNDGARRIVADWVQIAEMRRRSSCDTRRLAGVKGGEYGFGSRS
jgi:hypothetical protein